jgi:hypothetical protein
MLSNDSNPNKAAAEKATADKAAIAKTKADVLLSRSKVHCKNKDYILAVKSLEKAIKLVPDDTKYKEALENVRKDWKAKRAKKKRNQIIVAIAIIAAITFSITGQITKPSRLIKLNNRI